MATTTPTSKHVLAGKRIIVAGAGLAGLAFARALDREWPSSHPKPIVVIYERSSREQDRSRNGYTMGIRGESGLAALESIGLLDKALASRTTTASGAPEPLPTFWAKDWRPMLLIPTKQPSDVNAAQAAPASRPNNIRLVRHVLRDMLLEALPAETTVHWENACESAQVRQDGQIEVKLEDGSTDTCDLLIAADGANSGIRESLLPDQKLEFAGVVCSMATSRFPEGKPEMFKERWGMNISGQGVPFLTFPVDSNSGVWALSYRSDKPVERIRGDEAIRRKDEILDQVRQRGSMFHEPFDQFISASDPVTLSVFNAMHKYPLKHSTEMPHANVIFIGDANHPMSPFSGNGANMALADAVSLAKRLAGNETSVRAAIDSFDAESMPRSTKAIDRSWWVIRALHARGITFLVLRAFLGVINFIFGSKS